MSSVIENFEEWAHLRHRHAQTPAPGPVTLAAAPAQEAPRMSLITDAEQGYAAVKAELGKFEAALPGALADAKKFEGSAFAQLAERTAASMLPPEAVAIAVKAADTVLNDLIALYGAPQQAAQPVQPAPAQ